MEKARIRTGWKNRDREVTLEEFANALSSICWRMSLNAARNLHQQDFIYGNDRQRLGVIREYLLFLMHCADRLMFDALDPAQRGRFMQALARDCGRHDRENRTEIAPGTAPGDDFVGQANRRMDEYAATAFRDRAPGYDMYRLLGARIQEFMGEDQTNRWVIDQVMDIDGPEIFEVFVRSMDRLKRSSGF